MAELLHQPEHLELPTAEQAEPLRPGEAEPQQASPETAQAEQADQLEAARDNVAAEAEPALDPLEQLRADSDEPDAPAMPATIGRETRKLTTARELHRVQQRLPAPERALSRFVHQPAVQAVSEATAKTISRPSGMLGGGLVAFLGSGGYLYLAKHIGFQYNYFVSIALFLAGFAVGIGLELAVWLATRSHRSQD